MDNAADALAFVHQFEGFVDVIEAHGVRDEIIELELTLQVAFNNAGQLGAALDPTEGGSLPDATGDELERACGNFLACPGDANKD